MKLVVDANILASALIASKGETFKLLFDERLVLFAPRYLLEEVNRHKSEILVKSRLSVSEFNLFLDLLAGRIEMIPKTSYQDYLSISQDVSPDMNDSDYFALALALDCIIWSNDKRLKDQDKVKVLNTTELLKILRA